ncbi:unnamed protein product [Mytilus coruscus]|uniref:Uncharacterized protein n=1 Tax=Mytilus coruscus TaxID=42192 RepID=A0A6J8DNM9_MYTCO|nr:unnamed protein product [Mytilus coruscus]
MERDSLRKNFTDELYEDSENKSALERPRKSEKSILLELKNEDVIPNNGRCRRKGLSYYLSMNGSGVNGSSTRRPPRFLEKLDSNTQQNFTIHDVERKMAASENLHKEQLKAKGETARIFEERYAKLKEKREREETEKRQRIEEKLKRAEIVRNTSNREKIPRTIDRIMRVQERRDMQRRKTLDRFERKMKRDEEKRKQLLENKKISSRFQTVKERLENIERKINPVELILRNNDQITNYQHSPQFSCRSHLPEKSVWKNLKGITVTSKPDLRLIKCNTQDKVQETSFSVTQVAVTMLVISKTHFGKIEKNEPLGLDDRAKIYVSCFYDYLNEEERDELIQVFLIMNNIEEYHTGHDDN